MKFLEFREGLERVYTKYDYWLVPFFKAILALFSFICIRSAFASGSASGYLRLIKGPAGMLPAALLCSFLPWSAVTVFSAFFVLLYIYSISFEMAIVTALIFLLAAMIQISFRGQHGILLLLIPLGFLFRMPFVLPIVAGLSLGLFSVVPVGLGAFVYSLLHYVNVNLDTLPSGSGTDIAAIANRYALLLGGFFRDRGMILYVFTFIIMMLVVYIIRNLAFDYSWETAVPAGLLSGVLIILLGGRMMDIDISIGALLPEIVLSAVLSYGYVLLFHAADYRRTERIRFEDDDYYYYVKAVPKLRSSRDEEEEELPEE